MNYSTYHKGLLLALALGAVPAGAQDIDLDDITMTVVPDGMFEAHQLQRPDTEAIRQAIGASQLAPPDTNREQGLGIAPMADAPRPGGLSPAGERPQIESFRAAVEAGERPRPGPPRHGD